LEWIMTKDEMRKLLADLVPAAQAEGRAFFVRGGGRVREVPNDKAQVQVKPLRPRRIYQRQGVHGAGYEIETFKKHAQH
jgi:hypothetical protein